MGVIKPLAEVVQHAAGVEIMQGEGTKDVNGDPIPDSPWRILPLGDGDGGELIPTGKDMVGMLSPLGMAGTGMVAWSPTPIPANPPREAVKPAHVKAQ